MNFNKEAITMADVKTWIMENWAEIVAFFDKFYAILKQIIEG